VGMNNICFILRNIIVFFLPLTVGLLKKVGVLYTIFLYNNYINRADPHDSS